MAERSATSSIPRAGITKRFQWTWVCAAIGILHIQTFCNPIDFYRCWVNQACRIAQADDQNDVQDQAQREAAELRRCHGLGYVGSGLFHFIGHPGMKKAREEKTVSI